MILYFSLYTKPLRMLQNKLIFRREIYATACLIGGCIYLLMVEFSCPDMVAIIVASLIIFIVRTLSVMKNWSLPHFK